MTSKDPSIDGATESDTASPVQAEAVGEQVRRARVAAGLSMTELARRAKVSQPYISQLERGSFFPGLATLYRIAAALNLPLHSLLPPIVPGDGPPAPDDTHEVAHLAKRGEGVPFPYWDGKATKYFDVLTSTTVGQELFACLYDVSDEDIEDDVYEHPGEDFVYVMSGVLDITVGPETFRLFQGDALHIDGRYPHRWHVVGPGKVQAVVIASHPM